MLYVRMIFFIGAVINSTQLLSATTQKAHLSANWYPSSPSELRATIQHASQKAAQIYQASVEKSSIKAIVVPHAGYAYSAEVAASVYRLLDSKSIKNVIIIAPAHRVSFEGVALPAFEKYQTSLGTLAVNTAMIQELALLPLFNTHSGVFEQEHSLEIQLPFIQYFLSNTVTIVPLIIGHVTCEQANQIAHTLARYSTPTTLIVVSTDFIHYGKNYNFTPFTEHIFYNIRALNSRAIEYIEQGNCASFTQFMDQTKATICGYYPLKILLSLLEGGALGSVEPRLIAYDTSDKQSLTTQNSVSYSALLFTQEKLDSLPLEDQLTQQEKRSLLQEAYDILNSLFSTATPLHLLYPIHSFGMSKPHGVFVTLEKRTKQGKELRGCIGHIVTNEPLYKTVATVTRDTALHDKRFAPVTKAELPDLTLKLSILSRPHPIVSSEEIVLGKHGVILQYENRSAVFLPEVPVQYKWDLKTMLEQLSMKAGLPRSAWQDPKAQFQVFTTVTIE